MRCSVCSAVDVPSTSHIAGKVFGKTRAARTGMMGESSVDADCTTVASCSFLLGVRVARSPVAGLWSILLSGRSLRRCFNRRNSQHSEATSNYIVSI